VGLTRNLKRIADERIERARASLQMSKAKSRFESLPNAEQLLGQLQTEYDSLLNKMSEFYATRKRLIECKRKSIESGELAKRYKILKAGWLQQRRYWNHFMRQSLA
jgi:stearoyl-CoA desaturase (delta-9 desaturase)